MEIAFVRIGGRYFTEVERDDGAGLDVAAAVRICRRLDEFAEAWARVPDGGRLVVEWPPSESARSRERRARARA
jgi:hypothetical protein